MMRRLMFLGVGVCLMVWGLTGTASADPIPSGWTCSGNCGSLGADGVVSLSPIGSGTYQYVTTDQGTSGVGALPTGALGGETNGSTLATTMFAAGAGDALNFYFNYVTSDGAGFADYAWAALFNSSNTLVDILFTARTLPSGDIVPGSGMPAPAATLPPPQCPSSLEDRLGRRLAALRERALPLDAAIRAGFNPITTLRPLVTITFRSGLSTGPIPLMSLVSRWMVLQLLACQLNRRRGGVLNPRAYSYSAPGWQG